MSQQPVGQRDNPYRKLVDVETILATLGVGPLLLRREQVSQRRGQAGVLKLAGNVTIAGAVSTTAAPVREQDQSRSPSRHREVSRQSHAGGGYLQALLDLVHLPFHDTNGHTVNG